tara:strand:+ start:712 stop:6237 length:5526 start_codon:yes stop_codon:yes gene_type:complete
MPNQIFTVTNFTTGNLSNVDTKEMKDTSFLFSKNIDPKSMLGKLKAIKSSTLGSQVLLEDISVVLESSHTADTDNLIDIIVTSTLPFKVGMYCKMGGGEYVKVIAIIDDKNMTIERAQFGYSQVALGPSDAAEGRIAIWHAIWKLLPMGFEGSGESIIEDVVWYEKNTNFFYLHQNFKGSGSEELVKLGKATSSGTVSVEKNNQNIFIGVQGGTSKWLGKISGLRFGTKHASQTVLEDSRLYRPGEGSDKIKDFNKVLPFPPDSTFKRSDGTTSITTTNNSEGLAIGYVKEQGYLYVIDRDTAEAYSSNAFIGGPISDIAICKSDKTSLKVWVACSDTNGESSIHPGKIYLIEVHRLEAEINFANDFAIPGGWDINNKIVQTIDIKWSTGATGEGNYESTPYLNVGREYFDNPEHNLPSGRFQALIGANINIWGKYDTSGSQGTSNMLTDLLETVDSDGNGRLWFMLTPTEKEFNGQMPNNKWFFPNRMRAFYGPTWGYTRYLFCSSSDINADNTNWSDEGTRSVYFDDKSVLTEEFNSFNVKMQDAESDTDLGFSEENYKIISPRFYTSGGSSSSNDNFNANFNTNKFANLLIWNISTSTSVSESKTPNEQNGMRQFFYKLPLESCHLMDFELGSELDDSGGFIADVNFQNNGGSGRDWFHGAVQVGGAGWSAAYHWGGVIPTNWYICRVSNGIPEFNVADNVNGEAMFVSAIPSHLKTTVKGLPNYVADQDFYSITTDDKIWRTPVRAKRANAADYANDKYHALSLHGGFFIGKCDFLSKNTWGESYTTHNDDSYDFNKTAADKWDYYPSACFAPVENSLVDVSDLHPGCNHVVSLDMHIALGDNNNSRGGVFIANHLGLKTGCVDSSGSTQSGFVPQAKYTNVVDQTVQIVTNGGGESSNPEDWLKGNRGANSWYSYGLHGFTGADIEGTSKEVALDTLAYRVGGTDIENCIRVIRVIGPRGPIARYNSAKRNESSDNVDNQTAIFKMFDYSKHSGIMPDVLGSTHLFSARDYSGGLYNTAFTGLVDLNDYGTTGLLTKTAGATTHKMTLDDGDGMTSSDLTSASTLTYDNEAGTWPSAVADADASGAILFLDDHYMGQIVKYTAENTTANTLTLMDGAYENGYYIEKNTDNENVGIEDSRLIINYPQLFSVLPMKVEGTTNEQYHLQSKTVRMNPTKYEFLSVLDNTFAQQKRNSKGSNTWDLQFDNYRLASSGNIPGTAIDYSLDEDSRNNLLMTEVWYENSINSANEIDNDGDGTGADTISIYGTKDYYTSLMNKTGDLVYYVGRIFDNKEASNIEDFSDNTFGVDEDKHKTYLMLTRAATMQGTIEIEPSGDAIGADETTFLFPKDTIRKYKISYLYDGYQDSPLQLGGTIYYDTNNGYNEVQIKVNIPIEISPRITSVLLWRQKEPNGSYNLVRELKGDDTNWNVRSFNNGTQQVLTYQLTDKFTDGVSYSALTGLSQVSWDTMVSYGISTQINNYLFVAKASHNKLQNTDSWIFRSMPGNFSQFDWSNHYLKLPQVPTTLAGFKGRLFAFDSNTTMRINPESMIIEDIFEGAGCLNPDSVVSTPFGLFHADKNHIYMNDGMKSTIITDKIQKDESGKNLGWEDIRKHPIKLLFSNKENKLYVVFGDFQDTATTIESLVEDVRLSSGIKFLTFDLMSSRWDIIDDSNIDLGNVNQFFMSLDTGNICGYNGPDNNFNGKMVTLEDDDEKWEAAQFMTKDFNMGNDAVNKLFSKVIIYGKNLSVWGTNYLNTYPEIKIDGVKCTHVTTLKGAESSTGGTAELKLKPASGESKKGKILQIDWTADGKGFNTTDGATTTVDAEIHSISIIYRPLSIK